QGYSIKSMIVSVPFDTEMTIVAVAYDAMFMPSKLFRELIYLTKEGATPVEEFEKIGGSPSALEARTLALSDKGIIRGEREQSVEIVVSDAYRKAIEKERKAKLASDVAERLEERTQPIRRIAR
nr:hypothetical protein [Alistipes sp.]